MVGMETKGRVDIAKGSVVEMKGQLKVEGDGQMNITKGGRVDFGKPADGSKHQIGGKGMIWYAI